MQLQHNLDYNKKNGGKGCVNVKIAILAIIMALSTLLQSDQSPDTDVHQLLDDQIKLAPAVIESFLYTSSIDPEIQNLYAKCAYSPNATGLPIVIIMHGYSQKAGDFQDATLKRMADKGTFICAVGMRGRDGASGAPDSSAREIYDIYDAVSYIKSKYLNRISTQQVSIVGYSGGGGNALAAAAKFPDTFNNVISHFGISDYGFDTVGGWWQQNSRFRPEIEKWIGGTPLSNPNGYYARAHNLAISNYSGGRLFLFHDSGDQVVPISQSQSVVKTFVGAGLKENLFENFTTNENSLRWLHDLPSSSSSVQYSEDVWIPFVFKNKIKPWEIAEKGTVKVMGYIVTKKFSIWLGDGTSAVADVNYDTLTGAYTITPLTNGNMKVLITQSEKSVTQELHELTIIKLK